MLASAATVASLSNASLLRSPLMGISIHLRDLRVMVKRPEIAAKIDPQRDLERPLNLRPHDLLVAGVGRALRFPPVARPADDHAVGWYAPGLRLCGQVGYDFG